MHRPIASPLSSKPPYNPNDAKLLIEREDDFARAIARSISDYFADKLSPLELLADDKKLPLPIRRGLFLIAQKFLAVDCR